MDGDRTRLPSLRGLAIAIAGALVVAIVGFGLAAASPAKSVRSFTALEPYDQQTATVLDLGDPGLSTGDLGTFGGEIYSADGSVDIGHENSECVVGVIGQQTFQLACSGYFVLQGGQITLQGTIDLGLDTPLGAMKKAMSLRTSPTGELEFHWAITGGTDRYEGVRGQLDWGGDDPDATILEFNFIK
jgi:hypothetical protein